MKRQDKLNLVKNIVGIDSLPDKDKFMLLEYDPRLADYININTLIGKGNDRIISKAINKNKTILLQLNVYNEDILRFIIFNKDIKYKDIVKYKDRCNFTSEQENVYHKLLIEFVEKTIQYTGVLTKKTNNKAAKIMNDYEDIMPKFNYNPNDIKLLNKAMFVQLYRNGDDEKKLILLRRFKKMLDYNTMCRIGLLHDVEHIFGVVK